MKKMVIPNCTIEINLPELEVVEMEQLGPSTVPQARITLMAKVPVEDVAVSYQEGKVTRTVLLKRVWLRKIVADLTPVLDENNNFVLWTVQESLPEPDAVA